MEVKKIVRLHAEDNAQLWRSPATHLVAFFLFPVSLWVVQNADHDKYLVMPSNGTGRWKHCIRRKNTVKEWCSLPHSPAAVVLLLRNLWTYLDDIAVLVSQCGKV